MIIMNSIANIVLGRDILEVGKQIDCFNFQKYLIGNDWKSCKSNDNRIDIFRLENSRGEVVIPLDNSFADYGEAIIIAAQRVAKIEKRSVNFVLIDLCKMSKT